MIKKIKALGFVEIVIAIAVVGIVSAVFLTISAQAMKNLINTERLESMARIATDGSNIAQEIANQEKAGLGAELFPKEIGCYIPLRSDEGGNVSYYFLEEDGTGEFRELNRATSENGARDDYIEFGNSLYPDYFLVMCIDSIDEEDTHWANVEFIVGDVHVAGNVTNDSDIADFTYYSVIDL